MISVGSRVVVRRLPESQRQYKKAIGSGPVEVIGISGDGDWLRVETADGTRAWASRRHCEPFAAKHDPLAGVETRQAS